ncbi:GNAT family N-acetyltransferase [Ramlibacter montanisoli]|uniref:Peptidoglycan bridge formation glycyltransferase FemA/FemB family protein n=1 Tax=Ramlibacter montanisoli TaxID=2732512 RepID=A0A849K5K1_9BURK|nr:GNAT family N-acetyltransferase [Ramlibacter montanisoli]NNU43668.1 peptidoglycan bridge formation glycyltransferase FemA/FemB family protein [Ramlibacter montanisoli]
MSRPAYRSVFLDADSPHQRFFGWTAEEDQAGLRVLRKRYGVVNRSLVLLSAHGLPALPAVLRRTAGRITCADVYVHDFDDAIGDASLLAGLPFHRAAASERLLNVATFVIDLSQDESALRSAMSTDYRRKLRKAEGCGVEVEVHERPGEALLDEFLSAYAAMASERGLSPVRRDVVRRMYAQGCALLLAARRGAEATNFLHLYTTRDTGFFMYGVNPARENDGVGQFIHWRAMQELKARGLAWYDLGGVPSLDPANGIHQFKQKFGGQLVRLGSEWRHLGKAMKPLTLASGWMRRNPVVGSAR